MQMSLSKKVLLACIAILAIVFVGVEFNRIGDLFIYISASSNLFTAPNLYKELYGQPALFYYLGNPFLTLLVYPVSLLPTYLTGMLWKVLNLFFLFRIWKLVLHYFSEFRLTEKQKAIWQILTFVSLVFFIYANFHLLQLTIAMLYLSLEGVHQIRDKNNAILGGFLISLAIVIKISPIVLLPYLLYRKHFKGAITILALCFLYLIIPALFLGWSKNMDLWNHWWYIVHEEASIFDLNNRKNHGISTLLSTLFIKDAQDNVVNLTGRRHLLHLGEDTVRALIYTARAFFVLFTLYFLRGKSFQRLTDKLQQFWELSYLLLIIPLFFPQQRLYNFIFLLPAVSYLLFSFLNRRKEITHVKMKTVLFSIAILVLNLELILGVFRDYFWYHKTVTYATLLLLVIFALVKPDSDLVKATDGVK